MKRLDLLRLTETMEMETQRRRSLGGYSQDADGILLICETLTALLEHVVDEDVEHVVDENANLIKKKSK